MGEAPARELLAIFTARQKWFVQTARDKAAEYTNLGANYSQFREVAGPCFYVVSYFFYLHSAHKRATFLRRLDRPFPFPFQYLIHLLLNLVPDASLCWAEWPGGGRIKGN